MLVFFESVVELRFVSLEISPNRIPLSANAISVLAMVYLFHFACLSIIGLSLNIR